MGLSSRTAAPELSDEMSVTRQRSRPRANNIPLAFARRLLLGSLGLVFVLVAVFAATTLRLFVFFPVDQPTHVNGILSLNGSDEGARAALAVSLAEKGYAPVLLFSQGGESADTSCPKVPRVSVVCFVDVTNNTRGEAEWAGRYAARHNWHGLLIVTGRAQGHARPPAYGAVSFRDR